MMAPRRRRAARPYAVVGDVDLGAEGFQGLDVEVDGPAADAVAAHHGHESLARQVQQRPQHEHRDAVEAGEGKGDLRLGLLRGSDLQPAVLLGDPGADGPQDVRRDLDVADLGDVGDGARPVPQDGGHHVLGDGVLGAVDLDVADQGPVGLDVPLV